MKRVWRWRPALALVALTGCHRLTGLEGPAGEARHGNGYHYLALGLMWLGLVTVAAGIGFAVHARVRRSGGDAVLWSWVLVAVGLVMTVGSVLGTVGLQLCHGTC